MVAPAAQEARDLGGPGGVGEDSEGSVVAGLEAGNWVGSGAVVRAQLAGEIARVGVVEEVGNAYVVGSERPARHVLRQGRNLAEGRGGLEGACACPCPWSWAREAGLVLMLVVKGCAGSNSLPLRIFRLKVVRGVRYRRVRFGWCRMPPRHVLL